MYKKSVNIDTIFYMKVKEKSILKGATILGIGTFLAKLLGAIYRIPLTRLIGGEGIGLYQMIFPVYTVLLEFSGIGLPNALAKIISSKKENKEIEAIKCVNVSKKLFIKLGFICSVFMCTFSFFISKLQGNTNATISYIFLSPAIIFVSIISCYRGYFQGFSEMKPTAISQVLEQMVKVGFGLLFAKLFMPNLPLAVAGSVL
ncbi:MAG: oligosaccharide flippase family protein, partial [Clostridia bacterium]|nr:oligosaccharide flippase family protein [Clostridia bacterium]